MALVAYDNSSDSEYDEDSVTDNKINGCVKLIKPVNPEPYEKTPSTLFSSLPTPQVHENGIIEEMDDEFLHKKETVVENRPKRIKIDIPIPNYYSSDEEDKVVEKKSKKPVSGLFALLPPPKGTPLSNTSFVPNIVKKKFNQKPSTSKPTQKRKTPAIKPVIQNNINGKTGSESTDDEDMEIPETFDDDTWHKVCGRKKKQPPKPQAEELEQYNSPENSGVEAAPDVEQPYKGLDNKAFKELIGNTKRIPHKIKLIDIHEDEIRPDKEMWLKSLTDPNYEPETIVDEPVDGTRKVKNHITALAQKAVANDKELQMRWSENRFNRKQTQAKYGF